MTKPEHIMSFRKTAGKALSLLLFPVFILYCELVFHFSVFRGLQPAAFFCTLLFSAGFGLLCYLLYTLTPDARINRGIAAALLFLTGLIYTVEYSVYLEFKVLYDWNTVTAGAGDAVGQFQSDIVALIFSFGGFTHILLFILLPVALYLFFLRRRLPAERAGQRFGALVFALSLLLFSLGIGLIHSSGRLYETYETEYSFQSTVDRFGLLTGIRRDVQRNLFGTGAAAFEQVSVSALQTEDAMPGMTAPQRQAEAVASDTATVQGQTVDSASGAAMAQGQTADNASGAAMTQGRTADSASGAAAGQESAEHPSAAVNDRGPSSDTPQTAVQQPDAANDHGLSSTGPEDPGYSVMDIDFAALSANAEGRLKELDEYCASLIPSKKNDFTGLFAGKNLIFFSAEAFSGAIIDPELTPTLYRLSTRGFVFTDFYQPASAGTTGGEYENIMGLLPMAGGSSMKRSADYNNYLTMGYQLNRLGYYGQAFHNNSYTYYSRHLTHNHIGYSEGFMGYGNGMETYVKKQWPQSDLEMVQGTFPLYREQAPFNIYYMTVSGHSSYSRTSNAMSKKNWERVEALPYSDPVKAYIAANLELEDALTWLVEALEAEDMADDTVIVLCADHFPYGLDDGKSIRDLPRLEELYGSKIANTLERDRNTLILWCGSLEKEAPVVIDTPTFSLDILPTLSNLFGVAWDSRLLPGRDVFSNALPLVFNTGHDWKTQYGTYISSTNTFTPAEGVSEDALPENYVKAVRAYVRNKIEYCRGVLDTDYFRHVFGAPEAVVSHLPAQDTVDDAATQPSDESNAADAAAQPADTTPETTDTASEAPPSIPSD